MASTRAWWVLFGGMVVGCGTSAPPDDTRRVYDGTQRSDGAGTDASASASDAGADANVNGEGCSVLVPRRQPTWVDSFFGVGIYSELESALDPGYEDAIGIRLRTGFGYLDDIPPYDQVAGTFDLAAPVEGDYRTCRHCVFALMDVSGDHIQHLYLAESGTLVIQSVNIDTGEVVGSVRNVRLVEIEATGYYTWAGPIAGSCLTIPQLDFDTRAVPGASCNDPEDCPNAKLLQCIGGKCTR